MTNPIYREWTQLFIWKFLIIQKVQKKNIYVNILEEEIQGVNIP